MNFIIGFIWLLAYQLLGEIMVIIFELSVSGPVIGLILLLLTLIVRGKEGEPLKSAADNLLSHLAMLFVPAGVGLMVHYQLLAKEWLAISVALVIGTVIMLFSCALIMKWSTKLFSKEVIDE
ncbi:CidA/LrgA family protein [Thalassotalea crassostreae]|uniref:CidA/LrgA family protein n=1 Tax=Thalassotalea crassostreae TaxID=1763536 RepID=UPI0018DEF3AE|nr:CidA/LrgA family protein [Thalassotalea crassostreae]